VTIILNLSDELERELTNEAARLGLPVSEYALRLLSGNRARATEAPIGLTGAEVVAYWEREGVIGSRTDIEDPAAYAREIRERAQNRRST